MTTTPTPEISAVRLRDVTLRDGLQDEAPLPLEAKLEIFEALVAAGVVDLEVASFVRADRVPAMADAEALVRATEGTQVIRWGLVLNDRGAQRALACGLQHLQVVVSASDAHSLRNAGVTTQEALASAARINDLAVTHDAVVELTIATAFGCPFAGPVDASEVLALASEARRAGIHGISLADTIGSAVPCEVANLVERCTDLGINVGVHLHDTRGLGVANALAAANAGAVRFDASVGGLGGCPFAPGASGNVALEDLAHLWECSGVRTGLDVHGLIAAARLACHHVGRPVGGHVGVAGPRFSPYPHE